MSITATEYQDHMMILRAIDTYVNVMSGEAVNDNNTPAEKAAASVEARTARQLRDKLANEWV